ncbi:MAG: DUF167 domain-containing protein [Candidatus Woesearchaeota archaeon]
MTNKIIEIITKTNSPQNKIAQISENKFKLEIKAKPENNKANIEIEKFLSKHFKTNAKIISGFKSKKKLIKI